jgi:hypothetical protein
MSTTKYLWGVERGRCVRLITLPPSALHEEKHADVHINNVQLPQEEDVKYLGLHFDRRLTWHKNIFAKRKQLGTTLTKMYWLLGRKSKLSTINKLLIYKTILKPIWTYGIQLWSTASISNIDILEHFQPKALHMIVDAPWYVPNTVIRRDLQLQLQLSI